MNLHDEMRQIGSAAQRAARELVFLDAAQKTEILISIADEINAQRQRIKSANSKDLQAGEKKGLSAAMLDRLTEERIRNG